ncbi:MAG: hydroxyacid dehydrogenase, partial [Parasporobacterium sp.]|nr:hydroxyacid dehydrogenase [Parasporobacterium sp.]
MAKEHNNEDYKIIVLDDDPTGTQTVHDVFVYTDWSEENIKAGFEGENRMFYILTNSRSFTAEETERAHKEIARNILKAADGRRFVIVSRSDSTLRGHYPLENDVLRETLENEGGIKTDGEILVPFFLDGGRYTIDNIHYVKTGEKLIPAGETEFA